MKLLEYYDNQIDAWLYAERYVGGGTRTYSKFSADSEGDRNYDPIYGSPTYDLQTYKIPLDKGRVMTQDFGRGLQSLYFFNDYFLLPVHPDTLKQKLYMKNLLQNLEKGPLLTVIPTASLRTVFVKTINNKPVEPHFIKLHYPLRVSRFIRRLRSKIIALELWTSDQLHKSGISYLPEVGGAVIGDNPKESWGFIIRQAAPDKISYLPYITPFFALYGIDINHPNDQPLLTQLIDASCQDPIKWLTDRLIDPLVGFWCNTLERTGCLPETHGQNTLLGFTKDGLNTQVIYRDCDMYVIPELLSSAAKVTLPNKNVIGQDVKHPTDKMVSLIYDSYMGHHNISYIAKVSEKQYGIPVKTFQSLVS